MKLRVLAATVALALAMTACGGSEPKSDLPKLSATPSAAKKTTGTLLDRVPEAPPKAPKDVQSKNGAVEFSSYVVEMIVYTLATRRVDDLYAIADRQLCRSCQQVADGVEKRENRLQILDADATVSDAKALSSGGGFFTVAQVTDFPGGSEVDPKTGKAHFTLRAQKSRKMTVNLQWRKGQWVLLNYTFPKG